MTKEKPLASQVDLVPEVFLGLISPRAVGSMVYVGVLASSGKSASWLTLRVDDRGSGSIMIWNQKMGSAAGFVNGALSISRYYTNPKSHMTNKDSGH